MRMCVRSLVSISGLRVWCCCGCGIGSSDLTPSLGTSICHVWGPKQTKEQTNKQKLKICLKKKQRLTSVEFLLWHNRIQYYTCATGCSCDLGTPYAVGQPKKKKKKEWSEWPEGVPLWCSGLQIQCCHCSSPGSCCVSGLIPGPGTYSVDATKKEQPQAVNIWEKEQSTLV